MEERRDEKLPVVPLPSEKEMKRRKTLSSYGREMKNRIRHINKLHAIFVHQGHTTVVRKNLATPEKRQEAVKGEKSNFPLDNNHRRYHNMMSGTTRCDYACPLCTFCLPGKARRHDAPEYAGIKQTVWHQPYRRKHDTERVVKNPNSCYYILNEKSA